MPAATDASAERAVERLSFLQRVSLALASASTARDVAEVVVREVPPTVGAAGAAFWLLQAESREICLLGVHGYGPSRLQEWERFPLDAPLPLAEVVRSGEARFASSRDALLAAFPALRDVGTESGAWAFLPVVAGGAIVGGVSLGFPTPRALGEDERAFLTTLMHLVGHAFERVRLHRALVDEVEERRRAEAVALRLNEDLQHRVQEFQTLLDLIPIGIGLAHDPDASVITTNRQFADLVGVQEGTNISWTPREPTTLPYTLLRDGVPCEPVELPIQTAVRTGKPVRDFECEVLRADGARRHILVNAAPVFGERGEVRGALAAFVDVTDLKRADAEARERDERFRLVARATNDGIWDWDLRTGALWWNEGSRALFGELPDDAAVDAWASRIHPDDRERVVHGMQEAIESGAATRSDEYRFRRRDGSWAYILDRGYVQRDPQGRALRMIGSMLDMTERRVAMEALRKSEARYQLVAEATGETPWEWDLETDHQWWGPTLAASFGYRPEEMGGSSGGWTGRIHPDDRERVLGGIRRAIDARETRWGEEYRFLKADGTYAWVLDRGQIICDESGAPRRMVGSIVDVTARRREEDALRLREARLARHNAALVALARDGHLHAGRRAAPAVTEAASRALDVERASVWLFDDAGQRIRCIDLHERTSGRHASGAEIASAEQPEYFRALEGARTIAAADARADPRTRGFTQDYLVPHGIGAMLDAPVRVGGRVVGVVCFEHVGGPREWADDEQAFAGSIADLVALALEAEVRRQAESQLDLARRQLAQSEKLVAMGTLVSGVAHEIRTPLAYMNNNAHLLKLRLERLAQERPDASDALSRLLEPVSSIVEGVDRIDRLVSDLRRFLRSDGTDRELMPFDEVVGGAVRLFEATHRGGSTLQVALGSGARARIDKTQVEQVVLNLLENAADMTPVHGVVLVGTRAAAGAGAVELVVEDDGPGVSDEVRSRMFDPFFTTKPEGTGLGLSIVQRIVEAHGGSIEVENRPHGGARFVIAFPA